ncbi:MAG: hypothetical protein IIY21_07995 [Clostridiales bacterium]|nr:hypothetical protein [Clostridiales bacterium]MBQ1570587.1 hypothetical protein [Clostridiales bacterium]
MKRISDGKRGEDMSDLIRREDALKELRLDHKDVIYIDKKECARRIKAIPSADRPRGEWIDAEIPLECGGTMPIQVCNLCKTFYPLAYTGGGHRFCPNCGAKMRGADDE